MSTFSATDHLARLFDLFTDNLFSGGRVYFWTSEEHFFKTDEVQDATAQHPSNAQSTCSKRRESNFLFFSHLATVESFPRSMDRE